MEVSVMQRTIVNKRYKHRMWIAHEIGYDVVDAARISSRKVTCGGSVLLSAEESIYVRRMYGPIWAVWSIKAVGMMWEEMKILMQAIMYRGR
jgi:hypothetical protein